jgi:hypothetical protein
MCNLVASADCNLYKTGPFVYDQGIMFLFLFVFVIYYQRRVFPRCVADESIIRDAFRLYASPVRVISDAYRVYCPCRSKESVEYFSCLDIT